MFVRSLKFLAIITIIITNTTAKDISIDKLIQEIKHSKGDIKRQKINKLKIKLRNANSHTRNLIITKLQKSQHKVHHQNITKTAKNISSNANHTNTMTNTHITNIPSKPNGTHQVPTNINQPPRTMNPTPMHQPNVPTPQPPRTMNPTPIHQPNVPTHHYFQGGRH
jgi:Zn-dependent M16 (insulinase) family peptidase